MTVGAAGDRRGPVASRQSPALRERLAENIAAERFLEAAQLIKDIRMRMEVDGPKAGLTSRHATI